MLHVSLSSLAQKNESYRLFLSVCPILERVILFSFLPISDILVKFVNSKTLL